MAMTTRHPTRLSSEMCVSPSTPHAARHLRVATSINYTNHYCRTHHVTTTHHCPGHRGQQRHHHRPSWITVIHHPPTGTSSCHHHHVAYECDHAHLSVHHNRTCWDATVQTIIILLMLSMINVTKLYAPDYYVKTTKLLNNGCHAATINCYYPMAQCDVIMAPRLPVTHGDQLSSVMCATGK